MQMNFHSPLVQQHTEWFLQVKVIVKIHSGHGQEKPKQEDYMVLIKTINNYLVETASCYDLQRILNTWNSKIYQEKYYRMVVTF